MRNPFKYCVLVFTAAFIFPLALHAGGKAESAGEPLTVYSIKGPSGVGLVRLFEEPPRITGFRTGIEALADANLVAARFLSGEAVAGILPPNMAAKIAAQGRDIRALAVVGTGMLSLLSADTSVRTLSDLRGKTVEVAAQGATPDYVLRHILTANALVPGVDVTLGYALSPPEIAAALVAGRVSLALLPEPFATMAAAGRPDLISVADIQAEWVKAGGPANYPMTLLVADGAFADGHRDAIGDFLGAVKASVDWVTSRPEEAGLLAEKHGLGLKAAVVRAAIPKSGYVFIPAAEARPSLEALYAVFLENSPVSIGGALPADSFYYK